MLNTANGRFEFVTSLRKLFALRPRGRAGAAGAAARKDRGRACLGAGVSYLSGSDDVLCGLACPRWGITHQSTLRPSALHMMVLSRVLPLRQR